jgi:type IV secretion system protein VirB6
MSACDALVNSASDGVAAALSAVDCMTGEATAGAFARLFGAQGALMPALTALLTLYIAIFALGLLTGRTRLGVAALTPRMLVIGVVLTFATSWIAYQSVLWNLAVGGPDQIAGMVMGTRGSASQIFAGRIDTLFQAIADAADMASQQAAATSAAKASATGNTGMVAPAVQQASAFAPSSLVWLAAVLLMLGTVGLMVTARIVLAVLLALGPVFIVLGLMRGTRGLCAGWLKALVMVALMPLMAVIGGALTIELAVPVVQRLAGAEGIEPRAAFALFLIAAVHCALMALALKTAGVMVGGWRVFGLAPAREGRDGANSGIARDGASAPRAAAVAGRMVMAPANDGASGAPGRSSTGTSGRGGRIMAGQVILPTLAPQGTGQGTGPARTQGVGSRWRRPATRAELLR